MGGERGRERGVGRKRGVVGRDRDGLRATTCI